ncbi:MAG: DUF262 domain-containing protein [Dehalococcoidia bacterium]
MVEPLAVDKTSYPIVDFLEWQRQGRLDLNPPYQRRQVWNPRIKSKLIDSILRGYPLPLIFLHNRLDVDTSKVVRQVVDGQQRLRTILAYLDIDCLSHRDQWDEFSVLKSHNREYGGQGFLELPSAVRSRILETPLSVNVLPADVDDVTVLQIFQRMNSTGLKLNAQELRNAAYSGEFKDLTYSLAYGQNQRWLGWGLFDRQRIGQMLEVEFTADLVGLLLRGVLARTKSTIDGLYREYDGSVPSEGAIAAEFEAAFNVLDDVFAPGVAPTSLSRFRTTAWMYSCFALVTAADMYGVDGSIRSQPTLSRLPKFDATRLTIALEVAEQELKSERLNPETAKTLRGATADRRSRVQRINFLRSLP